MFKRSFIVLLSAVFFTTGCAQRFNYVESAVIGTAVGAGTGAAVGAIITNGSIGNSALLGAAIGLPAGLVFAALNEAYSDYNAAEEEAKEDILHNSNEINRRQVIIQALRKSTIENRPGDADPSLREDIFDGATIGNPYRL